MKAHFENGAQFGSSAMWKRIVELFQPFTWYIREKVSRFDVDIVTKINTVCVEDTRNLLFFFLLKLHVNVQYLRNYDDKLKKKKKYCNTDCRNAILCLASPVTIYTRITASYMIIQHAIFFSNFYVFYPIIEYRCPCKSSAFFSSRSTILLFLFLFRSFFISFSLNFLVFFPCLVLFFRPSFYLKSRKRCRVQHIILSTRLIVPTLSL